MRMMEILDKNEIQLKHILFKGILIINIAVTRLQIILTE